MLPCWPDLHSAGITLVLVLNRFDEDPEFVAIRRRAGWTAPSARPAGSLPCCGRRWSPSWRTVKNWTSPCRSRMSHRPVMRWQTRRRVSCSTTAWSPITIARSSITSHGP
ncbi:hypothetical protein LNP74_33165 [Klebsiella pneumoniae subsp. pneumoniae]|nr:hypothetical protein [Klebsiella pneumoniae subsp. pneumoniae]